eukprot:TRINITY_DN5767_c0_g1_i1.p1 TRINITY_DN5767_c0_g1~~TRINITY_DN5767_c0_g1_i1.p1  ORF type:complete len:284 (+),score=2.43 TRINITY_DN5767_c0_g1_i1:223-1074(+)
MATSSFTVQAPPALFLSRPSCSRRVWAVSCDGCSSQTSIRLRHSLEHFSVSTQLVSAPVRKCPRQGSEVVSPVCFRTDEGEPDLLSPSPHISTLTSLSHSTWASGTGGAQAPLDLREYAKESTGGPGGGGSGGGDDDGNGGNGGDGGGDGDSEDEYETGWFSQLDALPVLSLGFAALHAGYCLYVTLRDTALPPDFFRTAAGLLALLIAAALRLNYSVRYGTDSYILGLGSAVGVSVWSAERVFLRKETSTGSVAATSPAGGAATLAAAAMGLLYIMSIYRSL